MLSVQFISMESEKLVMLVPAMAHDLSKSFRRPPTAADSFLPPTTTAGQPSTAGLPSRAFVEKPKRPLSADNIFFKIERQRMLDEQEEQAAAAVVAKGGRLSSAAWQQHRAPKNRLCANGQDNLSTMEVY
jgi:hypothetical protein